MGIAVFAGMLGVTCFGLFMTPVFYSVVGSLAARFAQPSRSLTAPPLHTAAEEL